MKSFASVQTIGQRALRIVPIIFVVIVLLLVNRNTLPQQSDIDYGLAEASRRGSKDNSLTSRKIYTPRTVSSYLWERESIIPPDLTIDTGGRRCQATKWNIKLKASIIIDADNTTVSLVNFTIHNIIKASHLSIGQILVVCDKSVPSGVVKELDEYLQKNVPRSGLLHSSHLGRPWCHREGAEKAKEDVLVFIQAGAWVAQGWLEPMLDFLQANASSIATPRYDVIHLMKDNVPVYKRLYYVRTSIFHWDLVTQLMTEFNYEDIMPTMPSQGLRGDVWAIRKDYLRKLGGFDEELMEGGGAYTELAMRTWLCGGTVRAVSCARVAVLNTMNIHIENKYNMQYIVNKWLPEAMTKVKVATGEDLLLTFDAIPKPSSLHCRMSFNEYMTLHDVQHVLYQPIRDLHPERNKTMLIKSDTGGCIIPVDNGNLKLDPECGDEHQNGVFELTPDGYFKHVRTQLCLTITSLNQIRVEACLDMELRQQWDYREDKTIINIFLQYDCMQHTTHQVTADQIPLMVMCHHPVHKQRPFQQWSLVPVTKEGKPLETVDSEEEER